jgi:hypothetical protein
MRFLPGIAIFFLLAGAGVSARQNPAAPASTAPASPAADVGKTAKPNSAIDRLPGSKMQLFWGIDSAAGKIWQPGGIDRPQSGAVAGATDDEESARDVRIYPLQLHPRELWPRAPGEFQRENQGSKTSGGSVADGAQLR